MRRNALIAALLALSGGPAAAAAERTDDIAIGAAFLQTCVQSAPDHDAIKRGVEANPQWAPIAAPAELGLKPQGQNSSVTTWKQVIDGHEVLLVLIDDPESKSAKHNCAFVIRDERQAMWYFRSVADHLKQYGMKLSQQDIPHWRFYKGKFANGQPGQVEMRSRSAGLPGRDVLHLAVAY
jgi:hypothetical protein